jgi:hypothetical protein
MRAVALIAATLLLPCGGCNRSGDVQSPLDYGKLPGLRASPDKALQDELARIEEEDGTPEQLAAVEVAAKDNVAMGFLELFPEGKVDSILEKSAKLFPQPEFKFNPSQLQKAIDFRKKYDEQRLDAREALKRPRCDLGIDFTAGCRADLSLVDAMLICARLEAFCAAEALAENKPEQAIESLELMFRLASCLGNEKHFDPRLKAASLRVEAFSVLQALVRNDMIRSQHLEQLHEVIDKQLSTWPDDAWAWIGDRAVGLHSYEVVRDGGIFALFTEEEVEQFKKEGVLNQLPTAAIRTADADTRYYLDTMRQIIESCISPYHKRTAMFAAIEKDLQTKRNTAEFPLVAGRLLLLEIDKGHAIQAQDRALCEAWVIALALALGKQLPDYPANPLTGSPYQHEKQETMIVVSKINNDNRDNEFTISVPIPPASAK